MRRVIYSVACSLDGFVAGPKGEMDWLHFSKDVEELMGKAWANTDAILFGRVSWELAQQHAPTEANMGGPEMRSYVFSRTLEEIKGKGVELVKGDAVEFVLNLKQRPGKDITMMCGGKLASMLIAAGVVDEVVLNVHPVLLGSGPPAFVDAGQRIGLELLDSRLIDGGCVLMTYRTKK